VGRFGDLGRYKQMPDLRENRSGISGGGGNRTRVP